jgi:MFS superfamily sulfate permease-like transporter
LVRGVQFAVGLALLRVAYKLLASPPAAFKTYGIQWWTYAVALGIGALLLWRPRAVLGVVAAGTAVAVLAAGPPALSGPAPVSFPSLTSADLREAFFVLVIAQLPLTITSSCVATADAMHAYYGPAARSVRVGRLAQTVGVANLAVGASGGMMMCHGSSGVSAHSAFGARTWRAPALIGGVLLLLGIGFGETIINVLVEFPLPMLAGMMLLPAALHLRLAAALEGWARGAALVIGLAGFVVGVGQAVLVAIAVALGMAAVQHARSRRSGATSAKTGARDGHGVP